MKKNILDSYRVQRLISRIIRGNRLFFNPKKFKFVLYLNVGAGGHPHPDFINVDYHWHKGIQLCMDIQNHAYPFENERFNGIFSEHCLEHISYESVLKNLKEFHRLLKKDGVLRISMPDGELYLSQYVAHLSDPEIRLPYGENEPTAMYSVNRIFRAHGHQFIYDFETLKRLLELAGFKTIAKMAFLKGENPALLIDLPERQIESLYVEAVKD